MNLTIKLPNGFVHQGNVSLNIKFELIFGNLILIGNFGRHGGKGGKFESSADDLLGTSTSPQHICLVQ